MALVDFNDISVDFPVFSANGRSLKKQLLSVATGGRVGSDVRGHVVIRALDELSFTLRDGDRLGLIGHNGAGKTTLLRLLGGAYRPTSGTAHVEGTVGSLIDISLGIDSEASGRENIFVRGGLLGLSRAEVSKRMDEIVDFSELGDFIDMPVRTYSTGMHLRLAFAVSTMVRPDILLMDEWLSVGDEAFRHKAEKRLEEMVRATSIIVLASHSKDLILRTCNRVVWLEHGRVRGIGEPAKLVPAYFGS